MSTEVVFQPETLYDSLDDSVAGSGPTHRRVPAAACVRRTCEPDHVGLGWLTKFWGADADGGVQATCDRKEEVERFVCVVDWMTWKRLQFGASGLRVWHWDLFATETSSSAEAAAVSTEAVDCARRKSKGYVLDIDLDYFSTWNPFCRDLEARIGESAVQVVAQVFACVRFKRAPLENMTAIQRNSERRSFCEFMERFKAINMQGNSASAKLEWTQLVSELAFLYADSIEVEELFGKFAEVLDRYHDDEATRNEIWAAGPFLGLPHHESSSEEIERIVTELEHFLHSHALDASNPPAIVTIAKSTGDEYLPPHQLDEVLSSVLKMLERVFGELSTKFVEYEPVDDEDEEEKTVAE
ncbi:hypothetical protein ON010_g7366 [Phytophthora cinnamomi]|nr:hypothetical protein ON010_g7366 [Phytophthora cinnamomi]